MMHNSHDVSKQFCEFVRILRSLDAHELPPEVFKDKPDLVQEFMNEPIVFMLNSSATRRKAMWAVIEKRQGRNND